MNSITKITILFIIITYVFYLLFFHHRNSIIIRSDMLLYFNVISLAIFIAYMYESPEYGNNKPNKLAKKVNINISNRNFGRILIIIMMVFYIYTCIDLYNHRLYKI